MYREEQLRKYSYFTKVLEKNSLESVLDTLTGLVSRGYILGFIRSLIADGIPFTFGMLDLDNFKFINDTYGHQVGDGVLMSVAADLIGYMDGYGIVGRFGGDELVLVNLRDLTIEQKRPWLNGFYEDDKVLRKNISLDTCRPFITGQCFCAGMPDAGGNADVRNGSEQRTCDAINQRRRNHDCA